MRLSHNKTNGPDRRRYPKGFETPLRSGEKFSPLIEYLIPDAPLERKQKAQFELDGFMEVMYRIYQRLEAENKFPLPEDGSLTWPEDDAEPQPSVPDKPLHGIDKTASLETAGPVQEGEL